MPTTENEEIKTSVVIPVSNERKNLPPLLDEINSAFHGHPSFERWHPYEVIFVEDSSSDGTREWIDAVAARDENVTAIHLKRSFGQSGALAAGFDAARGETIIPMDGDGQNDARDIPRLLERLEDGYDCVSGWRRDRHDPWHKTIPSAIQTRLAMLTGPKIHDFGCTLKAYRAEALNELTLRGEGHRYIPARLHKLGYSITEIEVNHRARTHGESRYGAGRLVRGFVDLLYHVFWVRWSDRPMHIFGGVGAGLFGLGLLLGLTLLTQNYLFGADLLPNLPQLILSVGLTLLGFGVFALGIIGELLTQLLYQDDAVYRIDEIV